MINYAFSGAVAELELNRPDRRNALNSSQCDALRSEIERALAEGARAILITGAGTSFCSGADFGEVYSDGFRDALYGMLRAVHAAPVPVVAAVNGPAVGAGLQLAIACDLRVAAPPASFALPTARLGLAVDPWTIRRLALVAGGGTARDLLLACSTIGAEVAHARGLVDRLGDLDAARALAAEIAGLAPLTLAYNKRTVNALFESADDDPAQLADFEAVWASEDLVEGQRARSEKRTPEFKGH